MSKYLPPTRKGSEVLTGNQHPPTRVVFHGVPPGSREASELHKQYAPQINHFHRSQAQKYSLSPAENYRAHGVYPGLKMTYTNLHGHETLEIKVETEQHEEQRKGKEYWDWIQVDVILDAIPEAEGAGAFGYFMAILKRPDPVKVVHGATGFPGVAQDEFGAVNDGSSAPIVQYPDASGLLYSVLGAQPVGNEQTSSLLIDVRRFHDYSEISVDLYGNLDPLPDSSFTGIIGSVYGGILRDSRSLFNDSTQIIFSGTDTQAHFSAWYPELGDPDLQYHQVVNASLPYRTNWLADNTILNNYEFVRQFEVGNSSGVFFNLHDLYDGSNWLDPLALGMVPNTIQSLYLPEVLNGTSGFPGAESYHGKIEWKYFRKADFSNGFNSKTYYDGTTGVMESSAPYAVPPDPVSDLFYDPPGNPNGEAEFAVVHTTFYFKPVNGTIAVPNPANTTATMKAAVFKGTPPWGVGEYDATHETYYRWEIKGKYPDRVGVGKIAEGIPLHNHSRSGSITNFYDMTLLGTIHFYQDGGAVVFKRAP